MRVTLLGDGRSIHFRRWAQGLANHGVNVGAYTCHPFRSESLPGLEIRVLPIRPPLGYLFNAPPLRRWLMDTPPDLLHVHFASGYGTLGTMSGFSPRLLSVWGSDVYEFPTRSPLHRMLLRANLVSADAISSTSQAMASLTEELSGRPVAVVPFGVEVEEFSPGGQGRPHDDRLIVGTVRSLKRRYGVDILIRAFAQALSALRPDPLEKSLQLQIIGEGPQRGSLESLAEQLGVRERIEFVGWIPHHELPAYYRRMDVFVAPSRRESFGVAALEAAACGVPVVATAVGGLPEVVLHGETGLLVEAENPAKMTEALVELLNSRDLRSALGATGREYVLERYRWEDCVEGMLRLYRENLSKVPGNG